MRSFMGCGAWLSVVVTVSACSDDGKATDAGTDSTTIGDGDGDPTTGDGDGDPTTGDGDGDPTTGDGDGDPTNAECNSADQCVVLNDCCRCEAVPIGEQLPCDIPECPGPVCALGTDVPACSIGTCVIAPVSCDLNQVSCEVVEPPPCEDGLVRSVNGFCYGPCVPANACETLPFECDASTCGEGFACVTTQAGGASRCIPLPESCDGAASCDCVSDWWSEVCDGGCGENGGTLVCENGG